MYPDAVGCKSCGKDYQSLVVVSFSDITLPKEPFCAYYEYIISVRILYDIV